MVKIYLMIVFLGNLLSSYISFKYEKYAQGVMDSIIFSIAILLFMNPNVHNAWFIGMSACMYGLGVVLSYKTAPQWATIYRAIISVFGLTLILG